ncbi:MAG: selenocysteine-specific translation elongation factor [Gemmatimonadales bacterium]|nr:selenocysteine-specific translation elongation factor [Gemmatimonadales bacterium]
MIIGTAGHIDHGKSRLVEALTGRAMDRLAEERRRGITIDLNFAPLDLGDPEPAGVIDVPGHEDFIRTMVAGATGVDLVLLVVAADEGIMPQTLEHLLIVEQLGIRLGIPVVTKADLVEREWAELVAGDLEERLSDSPIDFGPPLIVSPVTGDGGGIDELLEAIRNAGRTLTEADEGDAFRMPIDRAFSVAGVGTVVTGTIWSGQLAVGDPVNVLPAGHRARVRSLEHYSKEVRRTRHRARAAIGLAGVDRDRIRRGDVIVTDVLPWQATSALDVHLSLAPTAPKALRPRTRIRVNLGTQEILARVYPKSALEPGGSATARLALEGRVVARGGDRFVVRSYSPVSAIGGGWIVDPLPQRRRATWPPGLGASDPGTRLEALAQRRAGGIDDADLPVLLGLSRTECDRVLATVSTLVRAGSHWVEHRAVKHATGSALARVDAYHEMNPSETGIPLQDLKARLSNTPWIAESVVTGLLDSGELELSDGRVRRPGFEPRVAGGQQEIDRVVAFLEREGLAPPSLAELIERLERKDIRDTLRLAAREGRVVSIGRDRYFAKTALDRFIATLAEIGSSGDITIAELRERLGLTRKFLIPLLEWSDGQGITTRLGDVRRLSRRAGSP